jgi:alginate O-acetyltransferase complex protein AlgF
MPRTFLLLVTVLVVAGPLGAQGPRSVYGPSAPGDSAFVRVVNLLPDPVRVSLGATRIGPVTVSTVSSYEPVVPDVYQVRAGGNEREVVPQSGAWLTIACTRQGIVLFTDPPHTDPARAQVFLYNLSSLPSLDLKTADGKTAVIGGVAKEASAQVVVNAVTVTLAVFSGATRVGDAGKLPLARGSSYSVFAVDTGKGVQVLTVKADVKVE